MINTEGIFSMMRNYAKRTKFAKFVTLFCMEERQSNMKVRRIVLFRRKKTLATLLNICRIEFEQTHDEQKFYLFIILIPIDMKLH